ncbi:MAG: SDR family NAD(P)-dependent oxidoreductase [Thermoleophilaceae bacterium]
MSRATGFIGRHLVEELLKRDGTIHVLVRAHLRRDVWDYWERNLDPELFRDRSLATAIKAKRVLITGASSGIGLETAISIGEAGGEVLLVSRTREKLEEVIEQVREAGDRAHVHPPFTAGSTS